MIVVVFFPSNLGQEVKCLGLGFGRRRRALNKAFKQVLRIVSLVQAVERTGKLGLEFSQRRTRRVLQQRAQVVGRLLVAFSFE